MSLFACFCLLSRCLLCLCLLCLCLSCICLLCLFSLCLLFVFVWAQAPGAHGPMVQGPWGPWDPYLIHLGQGPGPGPLGPGAWGPLGPSYRVHMESLTTYCQANYLLSGKATYCQPCTQPLHRLAPNNRTLCTQPFPHTCTQKFNRHAPKLHIPAPRSFRIHAFSSAYMHLIPHTS